MKKLLLLFFIAALGVLSVSAQSNIYVYMSDGGEETVMSLADIDKITFEGANMVITPLEGEPVTLPLTDMRDFRFSPENATGLLSLKASAVAGPKVSVCSGIVTVSGWDASRRATLSVYSVAGQQMLSIADWNGHDVDITSLPKGVYIIKIENQSTKIRK